MSTDPQLYPLAEVNALIRLTVGALSEVDA